MEMSELIKCKKVTQLPSGFMPYPKGVEIRFEPVTVGEKIQLSEANLTPGQIYKYTLEKIHVEGMDKRELTFPDFIYIGVLRRLYADEDVMNIHESYCPRCGHKLVRQFMLSDIEFEELSITAYPIHFKYKEFEIYTKPLTIGATLDMWDNTTSESEMLLETYTAMISKIYDNSAKVCLYATKEEKKTFILEASEELMDILKEVDNLYYHGLKEIELTCPNKKFVEEITPLGDRKPAAPCGCKWKEDYGSPATIIFPSCRDLSNIRSKIAFG